MKKSKFSVTDRGDLERRRGRRARGADPSQAWDYYATFYKWKSKYGGASIAELRQRRELEAENAKLKRMYADQALEIAAVKETMSRSQLKV